VDIARFLAVEKQRVDEVLDTLLPAADSWPSALHEAMRYAVFGGGKRLRPVLARAACAAAGGDPETAAEGACALEMIHTYSLIHDDLPAMDDDTLRRGRPTTHVVFGEAMAILAGDALLTEGFSVLSVYPAGPGHAVARAEACRLVAVAVGSVGMVGGQVEDLEAEGQPPDADRLERIHRAKTGALLAASVELGALYAGLDEADRAPFVALGRDLGLAFQIADDLLDATGDAATLGKSPGKDAAAEKLTYPRVWGLAAARARLDELTRELTKRAEAIAGPGSPLVGLVELVARRDR